MEITAEMVRTSLERCKQTFDIRLKGLTQEGIDLLCRVMPGELTTMLRVDESLKTNSAVCRLKAIDANNP